MFDQVYGLWLKLVVRILSIFDDSFHRISRHKQMLNNKSEAQSEGESNEKFGLIWQIAGYCETDEHRKRTAGYVWRENS